MILKVILIVLYLPICGIYALMAIKEKSKLLGLCAACWFVCAVLNLCWLARC
jgi:uncharacterized membrane protein|nr:MAG TPA: hypothetical protein [Caudoviricetes sp.]